jgi:hypothetical protein
MGLSTNKIATSSNHYWLSEFVRICLNPGAEPELRFRGGQNKKFMKVGGSKYEKSLFYRPISKFTYLLILN